MRATAKLYTKVFQIECPYCRRLIRKPDGSADHAPEDVQFGSPVQCDKEDCAKESVLTTTPKAVVEDVAALRGEESTSAVAAAGGGD
jgi:hypothetical protein